MSHFSVVVRLPGSLGPDDVQAATEKALAPFHEFECTGVVDEYVQNVDELEEARQEYEQHQEYKLRSPDGELFDKYDDRFYRDPTPEEEKKHGRFFGTGCGGGISYTSKDWGDGRGYRAKVHFVPDGFVDARVPTSTEQTFAGFIEDYYGRKRVGPGESPDLEGDHKFGWFRTDERGAVVEVIDRTNPNKKWDWWQIGGRWSGYFPIKTAPTTKTERQTELERAIAATEEGLRRAKTPDARWPFIQRANELREALYREVASTQGNVRLGSSGTAGNIPERGHGDIVRKGEIDWDLVATKTRESIDEFHGAYVRFLRGEKFDAFDGPRDKACRIGLIEVRREGLTQEDRNGLVAIRPWAETLPPTDDRSKWFDVCKPIDREALLADYADAFSPIGGYAYLDETGWHEPGRMGWWGCSSDTPETLLANKRSFTRWLKETPDDAWLVAVDCHI